MDLLKFIFLRTSRHIDRIDPGKKNGLKEHPVMNNLKMNNNFETGPQCLTTPKFLLSLSFGNVSGMKKNIRRVQYILIEKQFFNQYENVDFNKAHAFLTKNNFELEKIFIFPLLNFEDRLYTNLNL